MLVDSTSGNVIIAIKTQFKAHIRQEHLEMEKHPVCPYQGCGKRFGTLAYLQIHICRKHKRIWVDGSYDRSDVLEKYGEFVGMFVAVRCKVEGWRDNNKAKSLYKSDKTFICHPKSFHGIKWNRECRWKRQPVCPYCDVYLHKKELNAHLKNANPKEWQWTCKEAGCHASFTNRTKFDFHLRNEHGIDKEKDLNKKINCESCGIEAGKSSGLCI